jgi:Icc protein
MSDALRLLQFSDPHLFADPTARIKGVCSHESLRGVLAHARARHWNADALLLTGDLVHDDAGGYAHVRTLFGALGKPVYCLPGNHDDLPAYAAALGNAPFQLGGHVDFAHWRVVMLDSVVPGQAHGVLSDAELQRLDQAAADAGGRHVLVALHHHPVALGSSWLDEVRLQNAAQLFTITDRHPEVRAICWGHVHQQFDVRRKGVRLMAVPSTCAQFLPASDNFAVDTAAPGYRRMILHANGSIDSEVVRVDLASLQATASG